MRHKLTLRATHKPYDPADPHPRWVSVREGYVARITGRGSGPSKFARENLGWETTLNYPVARDEGLYEIQLCRWDGRGPRQYHVVLCHPEHGLILSTDCEDEAMEIAQRLDEGVPIAEAVEVDDLRPAGQDEDRMISEGQMTFDAKASSARKKPSDEPDLSQARTEALVAELSLRVKEMVRRDVSA